jgi:hypothetical protein
MFSITAIPLAIEQLHSELGLVLERAAKEPLRGDEATREIEMKPELINLHGEASMLDREFLGCFGRLVVNDL